MSHDPYYCDFCYDGLHEKHTDKRCYCVTCERREARMTDTQGRTRGKAVVEDVFTKGRLTGLAVHPCHFYFKGKVTDEDRANAAFIAEAFNVVHESGMTPAELWEKLKKVSLAFHELEAKNG